MNRQLTIRRLLAILVVAGLVWAPLSRPVMAGTAAHGSMPAMTGKVMADDMSMSAMPDEMAGGMPCCPSKAPAPIDCDKCLYMAACMSQFLAGPSAAIFHAPFAASSQIARPKDDFWPDGLGHSPPEHPPRTPV